MLTLGGRTPMRVAAPAVVRSMSAQPSPRATARSRSVWPRVASLPTVRQPLSELLAVGTDAGRLTRAELGLSWGRVVAELCLSRLRTSAELCLSRLRTRCVPVQLPIPPRLPVCTAISIWPSYGQAVLAKLCLSNLEPQSRAANPRRLCLSTLAPGPSCACPTPDPAPITCLHCHLGFAKLRRSCACPILWQRPSCACPHSRLPS